jgi:hypothetical protein
VLSDRRGLSLNMIHNLAQGLGISSQFLLQTPSLSPAVVPLKNPIALAPPSAVCRSHEQSTEIFPTNPRLNLNESRHALFPPHLCS